MERFRSVPRLVIILIVFIVQASGLEPLSATGLLDALKNRIKPRETVPSGLELPDFDQTTKLKPLNIAATSSSKFVAVGTSQTEAGINSLIRYGKLITSWIYRFLPAMARNVFSKPQSQWKEYHRARSRGEKLGFLLPPPLMPPGLSDEEYVRWLYRHLLEREPDVFGFKVHVGNLKQGTRRELIYQAFINSREYKALQKKKSQHPPSVVIPPSSLSHAEYVRWLYRHLLNREPDSFGFNLHLTNLKRGTSREFIYKTFIDSNEYLAINKLQEEIIPPNDRLLVSLHVQGMMDGVVEFLREAKPTVIKVFNWEDAKLVKQVSPTTLTVMRCYVSNQDMSPGAARKYVESMRNDLTKYAPYVDFLESYNETIPSANHETIRTAVRFDCEFADALGATGLPIAPLLLTVPVGNPLDSEVEMLLPAVRKAVEYGGALGYHAYWPANRNECYLEDRWDYYAGRWQVWDRVFSRHGLYPLYILGEVGAVGTPGRQPDGYIPLLPMDGWKSDQCLGGDWFRFLDQIRRFQDRLRQWNGENFGRCLGATLFTTGPDKTGWHSYQIRKPEMEDLPGLSTLLAYR